MNESEIVRVVEVFEANRVRWSLVGAHAVGLWTEPRATTDFDFIVDARKLDVVVRDLTAAFGDLDERDIGAALQLKAIDIDLIRSTQHPLFEEALKRTQMIGEWRVPRAEVLIVLKFLAAVSPWRLRGKKRIDVADIGAIVEAAGSSLDRARAIELSKLVYPGAEREFADLLGKIERDEPITI